MLLGKPIAGTPGEKLDFQERILYDLNMGYSHLGEMTPHSSIKFHKEENEFYHPWSIHSIGYRFTYGKLNEFMPIEQYLRLPCHLVENLLEGLVKGSEERAKADKAASGDKPPTKEEKELAELMKRMGIFEEGK